MNELSQTSFESWIGRNALGVVASILVIIGLVLLGTTFIPQLPNVAKALFVAIFALLLTAGGVLAVRYRPNVLSNALLVCGILAMLLSIALARLAFQVINDPIAFVLVTLWGLGCFGLAAWLRSLTVSFSTIIAAALFGFFLLANTAPVEVLDFITGCIWIAAFAAVSWWLAGQHHGGSVPYDLRNMRIAVIAVAEVALLHLAFFSRFEYSFACTVLLAVAAVLALTLLPEAKTDVRYYVPLRVNEAVVCLVGALFGSFVGHDPDVVRLVTYGLAFAGTMALAAVRARELPIAQDGSAARSAGLIVAGAAAPTLSVTGYLYGLSYFLVEPAAYSAVLMICALVAVALGFRFNASPLRLFGLVVVLLCVLKLVTIDIVAMDPVARIVAFVAGGLICFGISALYHHASRKAAQNSPERQLH